MTLLPFDNRDGWLWLDGSLVPWRDARLHVLSHGLHYASAVFEGERAYAGNIFRLRDHTDRLINSGRILSFEIPYSAEQIDAASNAVLQGQWVDRRATSARSPGAGRSSWRCRRPAPRSIWRSARGRGRAISGRSGCRGSGWLRRTGGGRRRSARRCNAKASGLYMIASLAKVKAEQEGYSDALMLDWRGLVAETTGANIFFVIDGDLHTPDPDCFLDGITRRTVISLAHRHQMKVIERQIEPSELDARDRSVPGRNRGRGDSGARDRPAPVHARDHHRDVDERLRQFGTTASGGGRPDRRLSASRPFAHIVESADMSRDRVRPW